jgi:hypothetical protein
MKNDLISQEIGKHGVIKKGSDDILKNLKDTACGEMPMPEPSLFVVKVTLEKPNRDCLQRIDTLSFNMHIHATFHDEAMRKARDIVSEFIPHLRFGTEIILKDGVEVK